MRAEQLTTTKGSIRYRPVLPVDSLPHIVCGSDGFCIACGTYDEYTEPDACRDECECCGASARYGLQELILRGFARVTD